MPWLQFGSSDTAAALNRSNIEAAELVVERLRISQFEAEVWNALSQPPAERKGLVIAAHDALNAGGGPRQS